MMYKVYEVAEGKSDLFRFEHEDRFECEVWAYLHQYEYSKVRKFEIRYSAE